jgi:hypothetical protein
MITQGYNNAERLRCVELRENWLVKQQDCESNRILKNLVDEKEIKEMFDDKRKAKLADCYVSQLK